jgi:hypothetical protein
MISTRFDLDKSFAREMNNLVQYSFGFVEGANAGKKIFFATVGEKATEALSFFIDSMSRQNPEMLHHVYEWNQTGSPNARLFDINYTVSNLGLSLRSTFRQSSSIKNGSNIPFYDKANMMENGISVTIRPRNSEVLVFEDNGETVFTRNPISVDNPGGQFVQGSFENSFDLFINSYLSQAFLQIAGITKKFGNMNTYKKNLQSGLKAGKSAGIPAGLRWITSLGIGA